MATIGLSKPYFAKYSADGTAVTYSGGGLLGKYTELSISLNSQESNILYADDAADESDQQFNGGTAEITTNDLLPEVMLPVLGLITEAITNEAIKTKDAKWMVFDDDQALPYLGVGGIIKKKIRGANRWMAFVLTKVQFSNPGISAVTQGSSIEWQTQKLSATIMRSDEPKHRWFMLSSLMDSAEDAETALKLFLNIQEAAA